MRERLNSRTIGLAAVCAALAFALTFTSPVRSLEAFLSDVRVSTHDNRASLSDDIVILAVDDRSLEAFPYTSPINRQFLASVVEKLDKSKVLAIGLDVVLDRPSDAGSDAALEAALSKADAPVVLVSDPGLALRAAICAGERPGTLPSEVLSRFARHATLGHGVLCIERLDEVLRTAATTNEPSFSEALATSAGGERGPHVAWPIPFERTGTGTWPFPTYSAAFIDTLPEDWFAGKVVLVGAISPYGGDWHTTPLRFAPLRHTIEPVSLMPEGQVPGVVIHAYTIHALLKGQRGPRLAIWLAALCVIAGVVAGLALGLSHWPLVHVSGAIALALSIYGALIFAVYGRGGPMIPFAGFAAGLLLTASACFALLERDERARRREIHTSFRHFLAPEVVDRLVEAPDRLARTSEERQVTALFTDLAGFTRMVDTAPPDTVAPTLNGYLDCIIDAVVSHGGVVDKIVGDAVHALFAAPMDDPQHRENAVRCAIAIEAVTEDYRAKLAAHGLSLGETRIGVNSGPALVGNFGGTKRFDYTAHGSTINVAARLEAENKVFGTRICVSEAARVEADGVVYREIGSIDVRGVADPIRVFEAIATGSRDVDAFAAAASLVDTDPVAAAAAFSALLKADPDDALVAWRLSNLRS
ncbi:MAG: adenylate/guanylate cyclase domain-containing protein [Pseudomonadota bacterium]